MIADFPKKLELKFWDMAIPVMSNNPVVRKLVITGYEIFRNKELRQRSILIFSGSFLGFLSGLVMFCLVK